MQDTLYWQSVCPGFGLCVGPASFCLGSHGFSSLVVLLQDQQRLADVGASPSCGSQPRTQPPSPRWVPAVQVGLSIGWASPVAFAATRRYNILIVRSFCWIVLTWGSSLRLPNRLGFRGGWASFLLGQWVVWKDPAVGSAPQTQPQSAVPHCDDRQRTSPSPNWQEGEPPASLMLLKDSEFTQTRAASAPTISGAWYLVFNPSPVILRSQDDQTHGEIVLDLEGGKIFSVAQHQNNPNLNFLCVESRQVELYHKGTGFYSICKDVTNVKSVSHVRRPDINSVCARWNRLQRQWKTRASRSGWRCPASRRRSTWRPPSTPQRWAWAACVAGRARRRCCPPPSKSRWTLRGTSRCVLLSHPHFSSTGAGL